MGNMKLKLLAATILLSAVIAGCAGTAGNQKLSEHTKESVTQNITEGKTTQAQVKQLFGEPNTTSFTDGGNDVYNYAFSRASAQGVNYIPIVNLFARGFDVNTKTLAILFDKDKIVVKYTMSETQSQTKGGVGQ